jgi:hypothetical protein
MQRDHAQFDLQEAREKETPLKNIETRPLVFSELKQAEVAVATVTPAVTPTAD